MSYITRNNAQEQHNSSQSSARQSPANANAQFADNRATTAAQLKQQSLMAASPAVTAQLKLMGQMAGAPIQRAGAEEELLQGKFATAQLAEDEELLQGKFETAQRAEDEELLQGKFAPVQRAEDEELLQGKFETAQLAEEEELLQGKFEPAQRAEKANNTGLPDNLKSGIESLSGMSMDNVKVHYNSDKPAQLNAHAYAQGTDIHVAPGQEQHLPHEAWHVVQQAQGRVKPTMQMKAGVPVNDDHALQRVKKGFFSTKRDPQYVSDFASSIRLTKDKGVITQAQQGDSSWVGGHSELFLEYWNDSAQDYVMDRIHFSHGTISVGTYSNQSDDWRTRLPRGASWQVSIDQVITAQKTAGEMKTKFDNAELDYSQWFGSTDWADANQENTVSMNCKDVTDAILISVGLLARQAKVFAFNRPGNIAGHTERKSIKPDHKWLDEN